MKRLPRERVLTLVKPPVEQFPIVEGTMCVEVRVPAHLAYVALLQGFVAQMTNYWAYQGDREQRIAVASQVEQAYVQTDWSSCMNCEELIACITPLLEAQTAQITNNILNQSQYGTQTPGMPMSGAESGGNIAGGTNPTCDLDILWAQCLQVVKFTNQSIVDVLEKVEVATNVNELIGLVGEIPILGWVAEVLGSELATETINYFQEAVLEGYQAQYTNEVENAISCELFCLCRGDCVLSVDRIWSVFQSRLASLIPETPGDILDLIEIMAGVDFDGTEVVDICFYFAWGAAKLGQFLFGDAIAQSTLTLMMGLAVDDASADWELLCTDCPALWCHTFDFTIDEQGWSNLPGFGNYVAGVGWETVGQPAVRLLREWAGSVRIMSVGFTTTGPEPVHHQVAANSALDCFIQGGAGTGGTYVVDTSGDACYVSLEQIVAGPSTNGIDEYDGVLTSLTLCGFGVEPDWEA